MAARLRGHSLSLLKTSQKSDCAHQKKRRRAADCHAETAFQPAASNTYALRLSGSCVALFVQTFGVLVADANCYAKYFFR